MRFLRSLPDRKGFPSRGTLQLLLSLHLPAAVMGMGTGGTAVVLPELAKSFNVDIGVATLIFIAQMAGATAAPLPTGLLADRIGRRKVLLAGPMLIGLAGLLTARAAVEGTFTEILVYRFIAGWGQQMWMVSRITVIADSASPTSRGRQITSMFSIQRVGSLGGPVIGGFLAVTFGLWAPFALQGILAFVAIVPSYYLLKETAPLAARREQRERQDGDGTPGLFPWRAFLARPILALFTAQFLTNVTRGGVQNGSVLLLFAAYAYDADPAQLGILRGAMAPAGIPFTLLAGYVMDRFGRKFSIVPGLAVMSSSMAFLAATWYASLPFSAFVVGFVMAHLSVSMLSGNMQTLGSDIAPPLARGRFFGVSRMVSQTGSLASPTSFAVLSQVASFGAAFFFMAGTSLTGALVVVFLIRETLHREPQEIVAPRGP